MSVTFLGFGDLACTLLGHHLRFSLAPGMTTISFIPKFHSSRSIPFVTLLRMMSLVDL